MMFVVIIVLLTL